MAGAVVSAAVVIVNTSDTPPMVSVVLLAVELLPEVVCRTFTVWPLVTVPAAAVQAPPLIWYSPPATLMAVAASIPASVIAADSVSVESAEFA